MAQQHFSVLSALAALLFDVRFARLPFCEAHNRAGQEEPDISHSALASFLYSGLRCRFPIQIFDLHSLCSTRMQHLPGYIRQQGESCGTGLVGYVSRVHPYIQNTNAAMREEER